jgi:L-ascorbate metabolism protein UlaG (beta-lactamase superfamily)
MHYGTFEPIRVDPGEFVRKVASRGGRAVIVEPGGSHRIA